jgi:hypothetical protein
VIEMPIQSVFKSVLLLVASSTLASCDAGDTDIDSETECECSSAADNYCDEASNAMACEDGCHFTFHECNLVADCESGCTDGECWEDCDCGEDQPECFSAEENHCEDEYTLMECTVFESECGNYFENINCFDPEVCPSGSGCALNDAGIAACWCDPSDGGVGDAGVDGGK